MSGGAPHIHYTVVDAIQPCHQNRRDICFVCLSNNRRKTTRKKASNLERRVGGGGGGGFTECDFRVERPNTESKTHTFNFRNFPTSVTYKITLVLEKFLFKKTKSWLPKIALANG